MALVKACKASDVAPGGLKYIRLGEKDLVLANIDGKYYAMENWCTHEQGNLSEGTLEKNVLTCPDHGAQFDVTTGLVVMGPDGDSSDTIQPDRTFTVTVQGSDLMVDIP
jgi:nitrite reductase/ring-hydroxylating ferredoxin subunit